MSSTPAQNRRLAASRRLEHVVVLGANGTMGSALPRSSRRRSRA